MPEEYVAESLLEALAGEDLKGKRVLLPRAAVARDLVPDHAARTRGDGGCGRGLPDDHSRRTLPRGRRKRWRASRTGSRSPVRRRLTICWRWRAGKRSKESKSLPLVRSHRQPRATAGLTVDVEAIRTRSKDWLTLSQPGLRVQLEFCGTPTALRSSNFPEPCLSAADIIDQHQRPGISCFYIPRSWHSLADGVRMKRADDFQSLSLCVEPPRIHRIFSQSTSDPVAMFHCEICGFMRSPSWELSGRRLPFDLTSVLLRLGCAAVVQC